MGDKPGGTEEIHEVLIHIELYVCHPITDPEYFIPGFLRSKGKFRPRQGCITRGLIGLHGKIRQHPKSNGRFRIYKRPKGTGNIEVPDILHG
jgi:hypothetical protein